MGMPALKFLENCGGREEGKERGRKEKEGRKIELTSSTNARTGVWRMAWDGVCGMSKQS